jgi:hypothetical protein
MIDYKTYLEGAAGALIISAAVRSLPDPANPASGFWQKFYLWFFNFTHTVMANWDKIRGNEIKTI